MCGRFSQREAAEVYAAMVGWKKYAGDPGPGPKYNVPPGTAPMALHQLTGKPSVTRTFWGFRPHWYEKSPVINARLDTILRQSGFWKPILSRRVIVPADGWFEWTGEKGNKAPWFISPKDENPVLLVGITGWKPNAEEDPTHGMAIITDDSAGGMVDIHDRRPIALTPEDARAWVDPDLSVDEALQILSTPRPESAFTWWKVTNRVGNSSYQNQDATKPI